MEIFAFCSFTALFRKTMKMKTTLTCMICCILILQATGRIGRPTGVALSKASSYQAGAPFICFDISATISFEKVNDDYCDCADASDEPGTSACPNGSFHCTNAGHRPLYIPSSRVNDAICDCCDGSDEYDSDAQCNNYCKELGKKSREEAERQRQLLEEGHKVYVEYADGGLAAFNEKKNKLDELKKERDGAEEKKNDLEEIKKQAEIPEREAKDQHEKAMQEVQARVQARVSSEQSEKAFRRLDVNNDGLVSVAEMTDQLAFDIDSDGTVSPEEAKEYLEDNEEVDYKTFHDKVWPNVREMLEKEREKDEGTEKEGGTDEPVKGDTDQPAVPTPRPTITPPKKPVVLPTPPPFPEPPSEAREDLGEEDEEESFEEGDREERDNDDDDDDGEDDDDEEEFDEEKDEDKHEVASGGEKDDKPEYDENTMAFIELADKAREDFNDADKKFKEMEKEISSLESLLEMDFGPNKEFYLLHGECYEMSDREYTYKLCPFDKATQKSKNGGGETNLGKWGKWEDPENNKHSIMKYEKGQNCWNGPDRSVKVKLQCGKDHELLSASEPNKCEYEFVFMSPTACSETPPPEVHDEL